MCIYIVNLLNKWYGKKINIFNLVFQFKLITIINVADHMM